MPNEDSGAENVPESEKNDDLDLRKKEEELKKEMAELDTELHKLQIKAQIINDLSESEPEPFCSSYNS